MAGGSSWMPYAPQGVKGFDDDDDDDGSIQPKRTARHDILFGTHNLKTFPYWPNELNANEDCNLRIATFSVLKYHK